MRKRRTLLLLIAAVVCVGVIAGGAFRSREPEYGGKKLSEWVDKMDIRIHVASQPLDPLNMRFVIKNEEAADAIRHIGTKSLPYLFRWVRYERPGWRQTLYVGVNPVLRKVNKGWELADDRQQLRTGNAFYAIKLLGTNAIPYLSQFRNDLDANVAVRASHLIREIEEERLQRLAR